MIAVAFALPEESLDLVADLQDQVQTGSAALPIITGKLGARRVVIFHTGVGATSAYEALEQFWKEHGADSISVVIGTGFAGGLDPSLPAGALVLAQNYPAWLGPAQTILKDRAHVGLLATSPAVLETVQAKAQFARQSGAVAVDMETATVAAFFREKCMPFLAVRVISDTAAETLPVPSSVWFDDAAQRPRPVALLGFLLRHPSRLLPFARFVRTVRHARQQLTEALTDLLLFLERER